MTKTRSRRAPLGEGRAARLGAVATCLVAVAFVDGQPASSSASEGTPRLVISLPDSGPGFRVPGLAIVRASRDPKRLRDSLIDGP